MKRVVLILCMLLCGCSFFIKKPEVAVKTVTLTGLDRGGVEMEFLLAVTNPNSYKLKLIGYTYNLSMSALPLANGENHDSVEFAGNTTTDFKIPARIAFRDLLEALKNSPDFDHIPYQLKAGFDVQAPFGRIVIPVDKTGTFAVPRQYQSARFLKQMNEVFKGK
jgi:LEA14-like dessication related protein